MFLFKKKTYSFFFGRLEREIGTMDDPFVPIHHGRLLNGRDGRLMSCFAMGLATVKPRVRTPFEDGPPFLFQTKGTFTIKDKASRGGVTDMDCVCSPVHGVPDMCGGLV